MTVGKKKRSPADAITVVVAIIVVAVLAANVLKQKPAPETTVPPTADETTTPPSTEPTTGQPEEGIPADLVMTFMRGTEFQGKTHAESVINSTQGKTMGATDYEYIVSGVVTDPSHPDLVYFATQSKNPVGNFVGVYQYNTKTFQWQRYYKDSYLPKDALGPKELRVIGMQGRNLIILEDRMNREEGDCDSYWLIGSQAPYALDTLSLDAPRDGLSPYVLPDSVKTVEESRVAACQK